HKEFTYTERIAQQFMEKPAPTAETRETGQEEESLSSWEPIPEDIQIEKASNFQHTEKFGMFAHAHHGLYDEHHDDEAHQSETPDPKSHVTDRGDKKENAQIFLNPLITPALKEEEPTEKIRSTKAPVIPVYERSEGSVSIDEEAENFFGLPLDSAESKLVAPEKRRRSKTDEIAAIAMVVLIVCLATLIYFAIQMSKAPSQPNRNTMSGATETSLNTVTTTSEKSTLRSTPSETVTTSSTSSTAETSKASGFDDSYFTKTGSLSGGNGTDTDSLTKIRMGDHHYFHRFVFDFLGNKVPTYRVSIMNGGYLVQIRVENITEFTSNYALEDWSTVAQSIVITADTDSSIVINIAMNEPAMVSTYGLEEPGRIVLDIRGESNKD
ncbi:MAG: hypothetical protein Q4A41_03360, partial [Bacillota bacterium]|nr:hypothetical protein [Bacillota bacterium]